MRPAEPPGSLPELPRAAEAARRLRWRGHRRRRKGPFRRMLPQRLGTRGRPKLPYSTHRETKSGFCNQGHLDAQALTNLLFAGCQDKVPVFKNGEGGGEGKVLEFATSVVRG